MLETLRNVWKVEELRKKLIYTFLMLLLYRLVGMIPVSGINAEVVAELANTYDMLGLINMMTGSAFSQMTVMALGISPYINASIIMQLLTVALPSLERLQKEGGEEGKKKIERITRYSTVGLGLLMGWAYYMMLSNYSASGFGIITKTGFLPGLVIVLAFTAGSAVVMWLGEQITEHGIGNGISMILFANIISGIPRTIGTLIDIGWLSLAIVVVVTALILFIVFINDAERRIPIQYAKRVVGRKIYGGQNTNLPIKVAMSGVMPVIFASSICSLPATVCAFAGVGAGNWWYDNLWSPNSWAYCISYGLMIFFFSWFYSTIQYDPVEIANNLKKNGGFIPGFRPGKPTADFIKKVINKIVIFGAVYLAIVALLPIIAGNLSEQMRHLAIGGTSVIIVVGVALETVKALEAQMLMRHYKGFLD